MTTIKKSTRFRIKSRSNTVKRRIFIQPRDRFSFFNNNVGWDITNILNIQPGRDTLIGIVTSGVTMKSFCKLISLELRSSELASSELRPNKDKPIIAIDIPKIIVRVIIFLINLFHSHQRGITQLPNLLNI